MTDDNELERINNNLNFSETVEQVAFSLIQAATDDLCSNQNEVAWARVFEESLDLLEKRFPEDRAEISYCLMQTLAKIASWASWQLVHERSAGQTKGKAAIHAAITQVIAASRIDSLKLHDQVRREFND